MNIKIEFNSNGVHESRSTSVSVNESSNYNAEIARLRSIGYSEDEIKRYKASLGIVEPLSDLRETVKVEYSKSVDVSDVIRPSYNHGIDMRETREADFDAKLHQLGEKKAELEARYTAEWYMSVEYYKYLCESFSGKDLYDLSKYDMLNEYKSLDFDTVKSSLLESAERQVNEYKAEMNRIGWL